MMNYPRDFEEIISYIFKNEGGYSNDKVDKGKQTNFGITKLTLRIAKKKNIINDNEKIEDLTKDQAKLIYYKLYWLPNPAIFTIQDYMFKYLHLDSSVNHGMKMANKFLQTAIQISNRKYFYNNKFIKFPIDGIFGEKSIMYYRYAVVSYKDEIPLYFIYLSQRYNFYNRIVYNNNNQIKFLQGWLNRLHQFNERSVKFEGG